MRGLHRLPPSHNPAAATAPVRRGFVDLGFSPLRHSARLGTGGALNTSGGLFWLEVSFCANRNPPEDLSRHPRCCYAGKRRSGWKQTTPRARDTEIRQGPPALPDPVSPPRSPQRHCGRGVASGGPRPNVPSPLAGIGGSAGRDWWSGEGAGLLFPRQRRRRWRLPGPGRCCGRGASGAAPGDGDPVLPCLSLHGGTLCRSGRGDAVLAWEKGPRAAAGAAGGLVARTGGREGPGSRGPSSRAVSRVRASLPVCQRPSRAHSPGISFISGSAQKGTLGGKSTEPARPLPKLFAVYTF